MVDQADIRDRHESKWLCEREAFGHGVLRLLLGGGENATRRDDSAPLGRAIPTTSLMALAVSLVLR